ncbi:MAG: oligoendopeptidase F [Pirellulales bacterium]
MNQTKRLPNRSKVAAKDSWDLASLFASDEAWERAFKRWERKIAKYEAFRGTLGKSPSNLAACLTFDSRFDRESERLSTYAFLKSTEDLAESQYQRLLGRFRHAASQAAEAASFIRPEIMAIAASRMKTFLDAPEIKAFRLQLQRLLRYKPHTLGKKEERLLAMQTEMAGAADQIFGQLQNADLTFGFVRDEQGRKVELSNASFSTLLHSPKRSVRKAAFQQYYTEYAEHENTLAAVLSASIQRDVYYAKVRGYASARDAALFRDNVPAAVYDQLIDTVHRHLPALFRYYDLRRKRMRLRDLHQYDTYVPILSDLKVRHGWQKATKVVLEAVAPLGREYTRVLEQGLQGRWCDRYPNQGKQGGAFSCGTFDGDPYILMNYDAELLDHVFTLAHEAGHSMHSHYSAKHQPYEYYNYTIFVAEVASTLNEQLLSRHLMAKAKTRKERAYLVNREIDAVRGTILRQTMFAEFEKITHALVEQGEPLTVDRFKRVYLELLQAYFGPHFSLDDQLQLECFRIPHFYHAFYVYKYATGMSAAIALAEKVADGGAREVARYLDFLKAGCSQFPLDLLRDAGVDMERPEPVETALRYFERLVDELEELLD